MRTGKVAFSYSTYRLVFKPLRGPFIIALFLFVLAPYALVNGDPLPDDFVPNHDVTKLTNKKSFRIVFGSCLQDSNSGIWATIKARTPDLVLFLGDNIYMNDTHFGKYDEIMKFYRHQFGQPELANLLSTVPNFEIWSDHDYGTDNSDSTFKFGEVSRRAFKDFWKLPPPAAETGEKSIARKIELKKLKILMTDDRSYRLNANTSTAPTLFGRQQVDWIKKELKEVTQPMVIFATAGPFLNSIRYNEAASVYGAEYDEILDAMAASPAKVIVLSGDRHYAEVLERTHKGKKIYEFGSSPFRAHHVPENMRPVEKYRVAAIFMENHFAELNLDLIDAEPRFEIRYFKTKGKELLVRSYPE